VHHGALEALWDQVISRIFRVQLRSYSDSCEGEAVIVSSLLDIDKLERGGKGRREMRTDADSSPVVLVRGSALAALLAVHTQPTVAPWLRTSSNRAQGTLKLMRWRW
jgi:hypothetical protein